MYPSPSTRKLLVVAIALMLAACAPGAGALNPQAARLDQLAQIKDQSATNPYALAARLDQLAQIKDQSATNPYALAARLDKLAQIKDEVMP